MNNHLNLDQQVLINSLYVATEGEGVHIGTPQIFIRFQGCHIGCLNCDSIDTWEFDQKTAIDLKELLTQVNSLSLDHYGLKRVSITGGDPLSPKHSDSLKALILSLKSSGYYINIEASGMRVVSDIFELVDFISFDVKTPSTRVRSSSSILFDVATNFAHKLQIKSVIETEADFQMVVERKKELDQKLPSNEVPWCLTPSYNLEEDFPKARFEQVLNWNQLSGSLFRVIGQQHKWIFGPDIKQV